MKNRRINACTDSTTGQNFQLQEGTFFHHYIVLTGFLQVCRKSKIRNQIILIEGFEASHFPQGIVFLNSSSTSDGLTQYFETNKQIPVAELIFSFFEPTLQKVAEEQFLLTLELPNALDLHWTWERNFKTKRKFGHFFHQDKLDSTNAELR